MNNIVPKRLCVCYPQDDEWEYAMDLISSDWYPESRSMGCRLFCASYVFVDIYMTSVLCRVLMLIDSCVVIGCVRRRQWRRVLVGPAVTQEEILPPDKDNESDEATFLLEEDNSHEKGDGVGANDCQSGSIAPEKEETIPTGASGENAISVVEDITKRACADAKSNPEEESGVNESSRLAVASAVDDEVETPKKETCGCTLM